MTVSSQTSRVSYAGNGSTTAFAVLFYFLADSHLKVILRAADGSETVKTLTTDYTVTGAGNPSGGTVTMGTAPAAGTTLVIVRNVPLTQETDYQANDPFPAESHERALDKLTMAMQTQQIQIDRSLKLKDSTSTAGLSTELPDPEQNKLIGWNESATGLQNIDGGTLATIVAYGTARSDVFTGDGSQTEFTLSYNPGSLNNLDVSIDGATQVNGVDFTWTSGATLTTTTAVPNGAKMLVRYMQGLPTGTADADDVQYDRGGGAVARTVGAKLRETVSVKDFGAVGDGVTDDTAAFNDAIDAIEAAGGGTLYVPTGVYKVTSKIYKTVSNITIVGDGMPWYNNTNTALVGGTIIQGKVHLVGDNIAVKSLGIDCGVDVCNAINSGNFMDALVLMDPVRTIRYNCTVRDVITLCKEPTSACHNFLFEGLSDSRFENLHAKFAQWGVVLKTQKSTADGLYAYSCSQAGLTIKSDAGVNGSPANNTTVSNVTINNDGYPSAANCILIYSATNDLYNCTLTNFTTKNGGVGLKLLGDTRASYNNILNNLTISNGVIDYASTFGFESFGAVSNVAVSNLVVKDTVSNKSIKVWDDCLGISLNSIYASALNTVDPLNIYVAGRFEVDNLISIVGGDYTNLSGINLNPDYKNAYTLGNYLGTLYTYGNVVNVTLQNGWTPFFSTVTVDARENRGLLQGRIEVPATPWTGKEIIGTIPTWIAPNTSRFYTATGFTTANKSIVPVFIEITTGGAITATYLNDPAFPAAMLWVGLDGISWDIAK